MTKIDALVIPHKFVEEIDPKFKKSCRTCIFAEEIITEPNNENEKRMLDIARKMVKTSYLVICRYWRESGLGYVLMTQDPSDNSLKNHDIRKCYRAKMSFEV